MVRNDSHDRATRVTEFTLGRAWGIIWIILLR